MSPFREAGRRELVGRGRVGRPKASLLAAKPRLSGDKRCGVRAGAGTAASRRC